MNVVLNERIDKISVVLIDRLEEFHNDIKTIEDALVEHVRRSFQRLLT